MSKNLVIVSLFYSSDITGSISQLIGCTTAFWFVMTKCQSATIINHSPESVVSYSAFESDILKAPFALNEVHLNRRPEVCEIVKETPTNETGATPAPLGAPITSLFSFWKSSSTYAPSHSVNIYMW